MRDYLKKLGKTKFQAYLLTTAANAALLVLVLSGSTDADARLQAFMPALSLLAQLAASIAYQWVEGSVDKAAAAAAVQPQAPASPVTVEAKTATVLPEAVQAGAGETADGGEGSGRKAAEPAFRGTNGCIGD